jgi:hypothetical protein
MNFWTNFLPFSYSKLLQIKSQCGLSRGKKYLWFKGLAYLPFTLSYSLFGFSYSSFGFIYSLSIFLWCLTFKNVCGLYGF